MATAIKTAAHPEICVTNHGLINIIVLDTLSRQGRSWEEFMRNKAKTTSRKQIGMSEDAVTAETKEQPQPSKVRVAKRPVEKPIDDRWPK